MGGDIVEIRLILIQTKVLQRFPMSSLNSTNIYQICLVTYLIKILFTQLIFFFSEVATV